MAIPIEELEKKKKEYKEILLELAEYLQNKMSPGMGYTTKEVSEIVKNFVEERKQEKNLEEIAARLNFDVYATGVLDSLKSIGGVYNISH